MSEPEIVFLIQELPNGHYEATAAESAISAQASTLEELETAIRESMRRQLGEQALPKVHLEWKKRIFGSAKGEFTVPEDFNDPLPKEIEDLFYK
jgi:hypothetical protein